MTVNIFEKATREDVLFDSNVGALTIQQVWTLPLSSKSGVDLDSMARGVNRELREITEESFVETKPDPRKSTLELKLEILKHIIGVKKQELADRKDAAAKAERKQQILEILSRKQNEQLESKSEEELLAELEKVS